MTKREKELEDLFQRWMKKQGEEKGWEKTTVGGREILRIHFTKDGMVDPEAYEVSSCKILVVLKEANIADNKTEEWLKEHMIDDQRYWYREFVNGTIQEGVWTDENGCRKKSDNIPQKESIGRMAYLLQKYTKNQKIDANRPSGKEIQDAVKQVAFMNLNKRGGSQKVNEKVLNDYVEEYKNEIKEEIERYSIIRTVAAVERADIVIIVIDAIEGVTEQDAKIAGIAHERGKGIIVAVNKWDAIEKNDKTIYEYTNKIKDTLSFMPYAEILFISALTGQRLNKIYELIDEIIDSQNMRVPTGVLNEILTEAVAMQQPPSDKGKRLRIYYITQVSVKPPTFVMFVNDKQLTHFSYTRYIENKIREAFGFRGTSIRFINRERKEKD